MKRTNDMRCADGVLPSVGLEVDVRPGRTGRLERAAYATCARRFLDVSRAYLRLQYTGSRHWYPNGSILTAPSAEGRIAVPFSKQGEEHVVG